MAVAAVTSSPIALKHCKSMQRNRNVVSALVRSPKFAGSHFEHVHISLMSNELVLQAVNKSGLALKHAPPNLQNNAKIVTAAVMNNGNALQHASGGLKNNADVVMVALANAQVLFRVSKDLRNDAIIVMAAITNDPSALAYASEDLKKDAEIVMAAVTKNGSALQHTDRPFNMHQKTCRRTKNS